VNTIGGQSRGGDALRRVLRSLNSDAFSFVVSLVVHLSVLLILSLIQVAVNNKEKPVLVTSLPPDPVQEFEIPEEFFASDIPEEKIGANSEFGSESMMSMAPELSDVAELSTPVEYVDSDFGQIELNRIVEVSTGLHYNRNMAVKGAAGEGLTGAEGALDRITQEILSSLEERKTHVVWIMDQSPSLARQHQTIRDRLNRIYDELGVVEASGNAAFKKHDDKPLVTSVYWFGNKFRRVIEKPTDNLEEIRKSVSNIPLDESGVERVFSAIYLAAKDNVAFRKPDPRTHEPERNVLIVVFTDEAGDDQDGLETTIQFCRRQAIPIYVVGAPAPFGRREAYLKWVDPDPKFDQSVQWGVVDQGPETQQPERLKIVDRGGPEEEVPIDSGFGPFGLTRLCHETGGLYFAVHPNRNLNRAISRGETEEFAAHIKYFFDPQVMRRYQPDYVSAEEYKKRATENKARAALVTAAQMSWVDTLEAPEELRFEKRDEAEFVAALSEIQKVPARLEPQLERLYQVLKIGETDREQEAAPRWQAGFDLAMGRVLALKARTEAYNGMLAKAKRGMRFKNEKNNTWVLKPSKDLTELGSQLEKTAERARFYLERVVKEHPSTPWALLAQQELDEPMSWKWFEEFTAPPPPPPPMPRNNNPPPPPPPPSTPADEQARKLEVRKPVREFKKL